MTLGPFISSSKVKGDRIQVKIHPRLVHVITTSSNNRLHVAGLISMNGMRNKGDDHKYDGRAPVVNLAEDENLEGFRIKIAVSAPNLKAAWREDRWCPSLDIETYWDPPEKRMDCFRREAKVLS